MAENAPPRAAEPWEGILLVVAAACIGACAWAVISGESASAGLFAGIAGGLLIVSSAKGRRTGPVAWFLDAFVDRLYDAAVFGSVAWATRQVDPSAAIGALVALGAGFLGAYVYARGRSLGYEVEASTFTRAVRYLVVFAGLLAGHYAPAMWAAAGVSLVAAAGRVGQVAKEERA
jgi:hypothetical protein